MTDTFAGARHNSGDQKNVQMVHDASVSLGASCGDMKMHAKKTDIDLYIVENLVATKAGEPYLWLPYGLIRKGDKEHNVTPELAAKFRMPHFKPAVKLGSHDETTPAGAHLIRHELRADGIWVYPELVPNGEKAMAEGAYRYHSPEIIWEDGYIQNPTTGEYESGPFIMGDALLHTPHLGEKTALYSIERNNPMTDSMVSVPTGLWDKFMAMFERQVNPPAPTGETPEVTQLKAQASEATKLKAELDALKAQATKAQELSAMAVELQKKETYGALYTDAAVARTAAEHFTAMPKETREWAQQQIRALVAQVDESQLTKKFGKTVNGAAGAVTAKAQFNAEILRVSVEKQVDYNRALQIVAADKPDLYNAYVAERDSQ